MNLINVAINFDHISHTVKHYITKVIQRTIRNYILATLKMNCASFLIIHHP